MFDTKEFFEESVKEILKNNPLVYYSFVSQDKKDYWKSFYKKALTHYIVKDVDYFYVDVMSGSKGVVLEICNNLDIKVDSDFYTIDLNLHKRYLIELLIAKNFSPYYYD